jgi:hypothetical protein
MVLARICDICKYFWKSSLIIFFGRLSDSSFVNMTAGADDVSATLLDKYILEIYILFYWLISVACHCFRQASLAQLMMIENHCCLLNIILEVSRTFDFPRKKTINRCNTYCILFRRYYREYPGGLGEHVRPVLLLWEKSLVYFVNHAFNNYYGLNLENNSLELFIYGGTTVKLNV